MTLKGANISGEVLDDQVVLLGAHGARVIGDHGLLQVSSGPLGMRARSAKRLFDLALAGGVIIVLSPLLIAVAIAIKLEDGGPVIFIQRRTGLGNRFFGMYKFRSMAEASSDPDGKLSTGREDPRITRVGRFIRRRSIDELPQLFNVLAGHMSLVGPRPHAIGSHAGDKLFWEVDLRYWHRHCLKPGLSGLAQVRGYRGATDRESDLVQRLQADLEYLDGWSLFKDIKILCRTFGVLVHNRAF
jgi:lipopolysaccharide/colanic/teichoic acid biosynthesis glycosyltransferase